MMITIKAITRSTVADMPNPSSSLKERLWEKVNISSEDECWEWTGARNKKGCAQICVNRKTISASRVLWSILYGNIPVGVGVCHKCRNQGCLNPKHLFLGTNAENVAYRMEIYSKNPDLRNVSNARKPDPEKFCETCGVQFFRKRFNGQLECYSGFSKRRFCSPPCVKTSPRRTRSISDRFWEKVNRKGDEECWEWTGSRNQKGYGTFNFSGSPKKATRVLWEMIHGPIPNNLIIMHSCDNPPCCNPNHLSVGTAKDNTADMMNKGRNRHRFSHCKPHPK